MHIYCNFTAHQQRNMVRTPHFFWAGDATGLQYGSGNSTTAEEVSRFQCLFPSPNWLVWKGIPPPKTRSNTHGWITGLMMIFLTSGRVKSCKVLPEVW